MAASVSCITIICLLLLLAPLNEATARSFPYSAPSTEMETGTKNGDYMTVKPRFGFRHGIVPGKVLKNCMPKGSRHSSAPSRYVNYHTLGSPNCATGKQRHSKKNP